MAMAQPYFSTASLAPIRMRVGSGSVPPKSSNMTEKRGITKTIMKSIAPKPTSVTMSG
jgi:hypothetical protein